MRIATIPILSVLLAGAVSCSGGHSTTRSMQRDDVRSLAGASLTRSKALEYMRFCEERPLASEANDRRRLAFEWVAASDDLADVDIDASFVDPLDDVGYPFSGELMMQYVFGAAGHALSDDSTRRDPTALAESGLRSMIAAYRNIVQLDPKLREPWIERLEQLRREGRLRSYVDSVAAAKR